MNTFSKIRTPQTSLLYLCFLLTCACSSDDDAGATSIQAQQQTADIGNLNNCNTSIGTGTILEFAIPYTASTGTIIEQLQIQTRVSDGGSDSGINTLFTDIASEIVWVSCFRFGSQSWVEYEVRLESQDGTLSNPVTTRVDRPAGAE